MRTRAIAVPILVGALAAGGCGSSSSSTVTTASTPASTSAGAGRPAPDRTYRVKLSGKSETPARPLAGSGTAKITIRGAKQQVCWQFHLVGVLHPGVAHIHVGRAGSPGPIIIPLGAAYTPAGCVSAVPKPEIDLIVAAPSKYYVNVHNQKYLDGAVRGQL
jgi:hypothetical protein